MGVWYTLCIPPVEQRGACCGACSPCSSSYYYYYYYYYCYYYCYCYCYCYYYYYYYYHYYYWACSPWSSESAVKSSEQCVTKRSGIASAWERPSTRST